MSSGLQILLPPLNPLLWFGEEKKRTRRGGGDVLDFPHTLTQIISVSELNKGGLTAAIATGLFLLHLLPLILTHTAALCPQGLNHLSSPPPLLFYSVSLFLSVYLLEAQCHIHKALTTVKHQQAESKVLQCDVILKPRMNLLLLIEYDFCLIIRGNMC